MSEIPYWMAIAHLERWKTERKNQLIIDIIHNKSLTLREFFESTEASWVNDFSLTEKEAADIVTIKKELPNLSFIAEKLYNQGFEIITINSPEYSKILKQNLKVKYSPLILYTKGNKDLMNDSTVAVVGSRKAGQRALDFTNSIVKKLSIEAKVIVSGFAKGVDRQSLDSSLQYDGKSIIVLPQGILTFGSGIKKYYEQIIEGKVLVLSTYYPNISWSVGLAMGRNQYIYGLAESIYVAETGEKGGTWSGAIDGIKKERNVYVLYPLKNEKNANKALIAQGGIPVDFDGNLLEIENLLTKEDESLLQENKIMAPGSSELPLNGIKAEFEKSEILCAKDLKESLKIDINTAVLAKKLAELDFLEEVPKVNKSTPKKFRLKTPVNSIQRKLF